jgi:hypothetical protein
VSTLHPPGRRPPRSAAGRRWHRCLPLVAAVVAVLAAVAGVLVLRGPGPGADLASDEPPLGAVLSEQDRRDLDAPAVERGAEPPLVDQAVDFGDPEAVARAYLAAAHGLTAEDAGRTHLRAAGYAMPGTPPASVGVLVLDPPPAGSLRTAQVRALELVAADRGDRRRGYLAAVETATGPAGEPATVELVTTHVVLARQPDGRWLVAADTAEMPDLPVGGD